MITVDQLTLINLVPRSHHGCCVLAAICFTTGTNYFDVEEVVQREQPAFRPEVKGKGGVNTDKLLGSKRRLFGHLHASQRSRHVARRLPSAASYWDLHRSPAPSCVRGQKRQSL